MAGAVEAEPTVERGDHGAALSGSQCRCGLPATAGILKPRVQLATDQGGIKPHHPGQEGSVLPIGTHVSHPDRRVTVHRGHGLPLTFAG